MMLRILDFPDPLFPISSTFFFFGFLTSGFTSTGGPWSPDSRVASGELDMSVGEPSCR